MCLHLHNIGNINQSFPIEYEVKSTSSGVCITCAFLESSTTGCVAVVHQRISQLSSSGLMNIESSHKFNRSGDTAYGCIEGIDVSRHQVGVIDGFRKWPSTSMSYTESKSLINLSSNLFVRTITRFLLSTMPGFSR